MKFLDFTVLSATAFTLASARPSALPVEKTTFTDASASYPGGLKLEDSPEGASVASDGSIYALNQKSILNLNTGETLYEHTYNATYHHLAGSRWLKNGDLLVTDAAAHKLLRIPKGTKSAKTFLGDNKQHQPNDIAISLDEKNIYLSGMNWAENTGELWYSIGGAPLKSFDTMAAGLHRTNGIELVNDDKTLLITSSKHNPADSKMTDAKIYAFDLVDGVPQGKPTLKFDIFKTFPKYLEDGTLDPDGMRADTNGNVYQTLNGAQAVLRWNLNTPADYEVYDLPTVAWPTNLEMGGKDGKTLVVVGKCKAPEVAEGAEAPKQTSCVDMATVKYPGKAWTNLQQNGGY